MALVHITVAAMKFVAQTHPDAPRTAAAFLRLLPWRRRLIHVRWSGEAAWIPMGEAQPDVGFENATSHPSVGDVLFYPGGYSETEILVAYGACSFSSRMGPLAGNHFLTIIEGREQLKALGRLVLWEGAQEIAFVLAPDLGTA